MLYLAQVRKNDFLDQHQLRLLARQEADNLWAIIPEEAFILLGKGKIMSENLLVLVELFPTGDIERIEDATNWVLHLVQSYLTIGITPEFLQHEAERAEHWRQSLTLQNQDLARRSLELKARREQIQALEKSLTDKQENQTVAVKKPQRGLKTIGLIIAAIVFGKVGLAVGNVIDDTFLVGTFFELVGFGYTAWFVSQNLLTAQARLRLWSRFLPQKGLEQSQKLENAIAGVIGTIQLLIPLSGVVDIKAVRAKLEKSLSKAKAEVESLSIRLNNSSFVDRARADVVQGARDALAEAHKQAEILRDRLRGFGTVMSNGSVNNFQITHYQLTRSKYPFWHLFFIKFFEF